MHIFIYVYIWSRVSEGGAKRIGGGGRVAGTERSNPLSLSLSLSRVALRRSNPLSLSLSLCPGERGAIPSLFLSLSLLSRSNPLSLSLSLICIYVYMYICIYVYMYPALQRTSASYRREAEAVQKVSTTIVTVYVSSYYNMCPRTTPHVSSYCYIFVLQSRRWCSRRVAGRERRERERKREGIAPLSPGERERKRERGLLRLRATLEREREKERGDCSRRERERKRGDCSSLSRRERERKREGIAPSEGNSEVYNVYLCI